jgi:LPXTG-site transpeptidase (sortase) family protein
MAEKLHSSRTRSVRSGWLLAIVIAATTLFSSLSGSHGNSVLVSPIKAEAVSISMGQYRFAARSIPLQILIPSISVKSKIMQLGLEKDGSLVVPPDGSLAGWYRGSPTPGEVGPSVIVGHVDWKGKVGVFFRLKSIKVGAIVKVLRADGTTQTFKVERVRAFAKKNFPTHQVYGDIAYAGLRLITCGDFNFQLHKYVKDIVVYAKAIA